MKNMETKSIVLLITIMTAVVLVVLGTSGLLLYQTAVKMQFQRLEAALELRIRMITVNIEHELSETERRDSQTQLIIEEKVIEEMRKVNETNSLGLGRPSEFVWGRREGADIMFLLPLRHSKATSVPFDSKLAEPMRLALKGQTGIVIGLDYRGVKALSAYAPLNVLNRHYGIVTKEDMSEIRAPFIAVGVAVFFLAVTVILAGVFAFLRITGPMLRKMQEDEKNLLQLETAREASRAKNEFLSMAAHELRAPLSGISGFAQTLRDAAKNGWLAKKEDLLPDFLNRILHSSSYMAALIEELLEFSRIESGTVNIQYGAIDLRYALDIVKSNIMDKINDKELEFKVQIPPELPLIRTGLRQLTQILFNLIGNAVKFVDKKGVVTVLAAAEEGMVLVSVVDSGPGMDEETQKHVFEIFWRGNKARGIAGSGLGLSITKLLVERMGGKIWIKSKLGVGSTFYFTLEQWRENEQG